MAEFGEKPPNRLIHRSAKFLYYTCRALQLFRFKYDRGQERLQLQPYKTWLRNCLCGFLAALVFSLFAVTPMKLGVVKQLVGLPRMMSEADIYCYWILVLIYLASIHTLIRLCMFLFRKKHRRPLQQLVNKTLRVRRRTLALTACDVRVDRRFKKFLHLKVIIFLLLILNVGVLLRGWPFFHTFHELFYCAYQTMQLTLLSLYRNLNAYSARFLKLKRSKKYKARSRRPIKRAMQLLLSLHRVHQMFVQQFSWFPSVVCFEITDCIIWTYMLMICGFIVKSQKDEPTYKHIYSYIALFFLLAGRILLPILNMFCLGLLNDELHKEAQLSGDYHIIAAIKEHHLCECSGCKETQRTRNVYILRMKLQPLVVTIFPNTPLNRQFIGDIVKILVFTFTFTLCFGG